jgi:hypothetical protein
MDVLIFKIDFRGPPLFGAGAGVATAEPGIRVTA